MRRLLLPLALLPIVATASAQEDHRPVTLGLEYKEPYLCGSYFDQVISMRLDYNLHDGRTDRVDLTWPGFTPGMESVDDVWRLGISARPEVWRLGHRSAADEKPLRPAEFYFALHYLSPRMSAKFFYPLAKTIGGHSFSPCLELERLELLHLGRLSILARGGTREDMPDWGIGLTLRCGNPSGGHLQLGAFTDKPVWYFSYQTPLNY